ncbi:membrane-associated phosphatidylinositol transfer protein 3 isoform X5 [Pristis pectinata]|uniref:membrane-associated phosphatidylinositol transfer protein 3 isoform X5 n=1 Tax=Pristis pectinata TaxID=685728 RepID=UPI00223E5379|nr:membrane-associated phosphatidylinositol transfer protein 3 isoform X5 [Pristis pectinata]
MKITVLQCSASCRYTHSQWRMQNIVHDSGDSSEDEFFDARDEVVEGKNALLLGMSTWNSNDLVEQIETIGKLDDGQGDMYRDSLSRQGCPTQGSVEGQEDSEDVKKCKIRVLILVLHGGNILDTGGGDQNSKAADVNTFTSVLEKVTSAHFPAALGHFLIKLVPCPPICSEAFSLVSNLNPYSYDEGCLSSNEDHIPLAALPLLAISSPQYQDAVATVINRTNQIYNEFLKSEDGIGFNGQVCLIGDCVGGILGFDALCYSSHTTCESQNSSRRGSIGSIQDNTHLTDEPGSDLSSSKRLSRSNIDISGIEAKEPRKLLQRKQSDSSTYDCDTITQHHAFLSRIHSSTLNDDPDLQRMNSTNILDGNPGRFDFDVSDFFLFGSPLALVLAMRWTVLPSVDVAQLRPACTQVYSLFHSADPSASRLEPLLEKSFHLLPPVSVPRYQRYPLGDGNSTLLADLIQSHHSLFLECSNASTSPNTLLTQLQRDIRRGSQTSITSEVSGSSENFLAANIAGITAKWWGTKRIDYALYCPDALTAFPTVALPHLFHASYWESTDVLAFVLRQNVTANHRANDVIVAEGVPQMLVGRFMYGPLDMVTLTGEKVDILLMTQPPAGRWVYFDTEITSNSGRILYTIPDEKKLSVGVYPVKMVVRGDQTFAESYLTVLPKGMECVVFSIDGSFAASVSIMGSDPKVRAGAVDVVRHWQDLGYLIIYVTGRPDMQKQRVVSWLGQHNFPQGMITFSEGLVHDPLRQKTIFLRNLVQESHIKIAAAYGSMKDISVYNVLGLSASQIYIVGRPSKKYQNQCQFLSEGYAAHLAQLEFSHRSRPKKSNSRMILRKGSFGLTAQPDFLRKRNHLRRTMSVQQPDPPSCNPKPERAQSQPESDKVERHPHSIAWARSGGSKSEPGV